VRERLYAVSSAIADLDDSGDIQFKVRKNGEDVDRYAETFDEVHEIEAAEERAKTRKAMGWQSSRTMQALFASCQARGSSRHLSTAPRSSPSDVCVGRAGCVEVNPCRGQPLSLYVACHLGPPSIAKQQMPAFREQNPPDQASKYVVRMGATRR